MVDWLVFVNYCLYIIKSKLLLCISIFLYQYLIIYFVVIQDGTTYCDMSFPATSGSIAKTSQCKLARLTVQWLTPGMISSPRGEDKIPWVVYRTPMPEDISQGQLGNCWVRLIHANGIFKVKKCLQIERKWSQTPIFQTSCLLLCNGEVITKGSYCVIRMYARIVFHMPRRFFLQTIDLRQILLKSSKHRQTRVAHSPFNYTWSLIT